MRKGFGETKLNNVLTMFPELNRDWLLYGEGEMLNDGTSQSNIPAKGIKILDIRVCAGYGIGFDGDENKVLDVMNIPQYNGCYGVTVYGDSMYDIYAPGDIVFVREVTDKTFIDNGQAYIVITAEDRLLKLLYVEDEKITLVSYNTTTNPDGRRKYPDICMKPESIIKLYKVVGRLTRGQM
jgi:phage repressor protein C with HTH and peptisase S24 domain